MGADQSTSNQKQLKIISQGNWKNMGVQNDPKYIDISLSNSLGQVRIYEKNSDQSVRVAVQSCILQSEAEFQRVWSSLKMIQQKGQNAQGIVKILEIMNLSEDQFCSNFFKVIVAYEYFDLSLGDLIIQRLHGHQVFQAPEIVDFLSQILSSLGAMNWDGHGDLRPRRILVAQNPTGRVYKVTEPADQYRKLLMSNEVDEPCFLPPEVLESLVHRQVNVKYSREASDIWTLGLVALQMGTLADSQAIYDWDSASIYEEQLESILIVFGSTHGQALGKVVRQMLSIDFQQRPSFISLKQLLSKITVVSVPEQENKSSRLFSHREGSISSPLNNRYSEQRQSEQRQSEQRQSEQRQSRPASPPQYQYSQRNSPQQPQVVISQPIKVNSTLKGPIRDSLQRNWAKEFLNDTDTKVHVPCNPDDQFMNLHHDELKNTYTNQFAYNNIVEIPEPKEEHKLIPIPMQDQTNKPAPKQESKKIEKVEQSTAQSRAALKRPKTGITYLSNKSTGQGSNIKQKGAENKPKQNTKWVQ